MQDILHYGAFLLRRSLTLKDLLFGYDICKKNGYRGWRMAEKCLAYSADIV